MLNGKRVLSMVLALIMVCANLPWTAVATELAEATVATEVTQNAEATQPDETTQPTEATAPAEELKKEEAAVTDVPAATGVSYIYQVMMRIPTYQVGDSIPAADEIDVEIDVDGVEVVWVGDIYIQNSDEDPGEYFGNKLYRISVDIQAPEGKQFSDEIEVFGDNVAWWEFVNDGNLQVCFEYDFRLPQVDTIEIDGLPETIQAGEAKLPENMAVDGNAQITAARWVDENHDPVSAFVDGNDYYLELTLAPNEGYGFRYFLDCRNNTTEAYVDADIVDENTAKAYFGYSLKPDAGPFTINIDGVYVGADVTAYNITVDGNVALDYKWIFDNQTTETIIAGVFEADREYRIGMSFVPKDGYAFYEDTQFTVEGPTGIADWQSQYYGPDEFNVWVDFDYRTLIDQVELTVSGLQAGEPVSGVTYEASEGVTVDYVELICSNEILETGNIPKNELRIYFELSAKSGYVFADELVFLINGERCRTIDNSEGSLAGYQFFDFRDPAAESIYIWETPEEIYPGALPELDLTFESDHAYVEDYRWLNGDKQPVSQIVDGYAYLLEVSVRAEEGYAFRDWVDTNGDDYEIISDSELLVYFEYSLLPDAGRVDLTVSGIEVGASVETVDVDITGNAVVDEFRITSEQCDDDYVTSGVFQDDWFYSVNITLKPAQGYRFTSDNIPYINGERDYNYSMADDGSVLYIWVSCDFRDPVVEYIFVENLPERFDLTPGAVQNPELSLWFDGDFTDAAQITDICWVNADKEPVTALEAGQDYYLQVKVSPSTGYRFEEGWTYIRSDGYYYDGDDFAIIDEDEAVAWFYYSLKPETGDIKLTVTGFAQGKPVDGVKATVSGNALITNFYIYNRTDDALVTTGKFEKGKIYYIYYELTPADGYRFGNDTLIFVNGKQENASGTMYAEVSCKLVTCELIETVSLTVSKVELGKNLADVKVTVPKGVNYTVSPKWYDATYDPEYGTDWKTPGKTFEKGHSYRLEISIEPKEGYALAESVKVTINGESGNYSFSDDGLSGDVSKEYSFLHVIDEVHLPAVPESLKIGDTLPTDFAVPSDANYKIEAQWLTLNENDITQVDKAGTYMLCFYLYAKKGYEFSKNATVYLGDNEHTKFEAYPYDMSVYKVYNVDTTMVDRIDISVATPVAGAETGKPEVTATTELAAYHRWTKSSHPEGWSDYSTTTFEQGKYHFLRIEIMPEDDSYAFVDQLNVYVNGKKATPVQVRSLGFYYAVVIAFGKLGEAKPMPVPSVKVEKMDDGQYLVWNGDFNATDYEIYRATSKSGKYTKVATVTETMWLDTNVTAGKTYYYKIKAVNSTNSKLNSGYSNIVSTDIPCGIPVIAVQAGPTGKPVLSWDKVTAAKKYEIWRSVDGATFKKLTTTTKTTYTDTNATSGTLCTYKVKAVGSSSKYNSEFCVEQSCYVTCAAPVLSVKVDTATGKPSLSWKKITGAVSYDIYRAVNGGEFTLLTNTDAISYLDEATEADSQYSYYVVSVGTQAEFNSVASETKVVTVTVGQPKLSSLINSAGKPVITWEAVEDAVEYEIYRSTSATKSYKLVLTTTDLSYTDESVAAGKTYYYKVTAVGQNSENTSAYVKLTGKCDIPVLNVEAGSTGKPVLTWNKISGAKKYEIWRSVDGAAFKKLTTVTKTTYTDTKATEGAECVYKVKALGSKSAYNGEFSTEHGCYVTCAAPTLTAKIDTATGKPSLSWKKITGAVSYDIYRAVNGGEFVLLTNTDAISYLDEATEADNQYSYYVVSIGKQAEFNSVASEVKTVTVTVGQPKVTGAVNANGKPVITWEAVEDAVEYEIYRSTSATKSYKLVITTEDLSYVDESVAAGKTYYYKITAIGQNSENTSAYVKLTGKCDIPELSVEAGSTGKPVLTWNKISGAKKYEIWRSVDGAAFKKLTTVTKTTYTDTKATEGAECVYKVKALGSKSAYNGEFSTEHGCYVTCAAPVLTVKVDTATGKPSLSWKKITGAVSYDIYRAVNGGEFVLLTNTDAISYLDEATEADNQYSYYVVSIGKQAEFNSVASEVKTVTVTVGQPKVIGTVNANGKPVITWEAVEDAVEYEIYRSTSATKSYKLVLTTADLSYTDESVATGKTYYYKVTAVGQNSENTSAYVKLTGKCAQPEASASLDIKSGKPIITWEKITGAKKYEVYRATSVDGKYSKIGTSTKLSYTDTKASVGTTYYYKVVAAGSKSAYNSLYSAATEGVTALLAQPAVKVKVDSKTGNPVVSWGKVSGSEEYLVMYVDVTEFVESESGPDEAYLEEHLMNVTTTKTSVTLTDTEAGHIYLVTVVAVPGNEAYCSVPADPQYVASTCVAPKITGFIDEYYGKPGAYWNEVEGAEAYAVYRSTKSGSGYKFLGYVEGDYFIDGSAVKGKTYYYKVTAVTYYTESAMSNYVKLKSK